MVDAAITTVEQWKAAHGQELIYCKALKGEWTLTACLERQAGSRHFFKKGKHEDEEQLRPMFVSCKGCDYFKPVHDGEVVTTRELVGGFNAYTGAPEKQNPDKDKPKKKAPKDRIVPRFQWRNKPGVSAKWDRKRGDGCSTESRS